MNTEEYQSRLDCAVEIATEAGELTLRHFRQDSLKVERKGDDSPVTIADKSAEELLRQRITERFPEDAIVGEEHDDKLGNSGYTWVLDPIDGTKSFIHGIPLYTTLIGILETKGGEITDGESVVGVIRAPALDEMVYARRGGGAWYKTGSAPPKPARVSQTTDFSQALLVHTDISSYRKRPSGQGMQALSTLEQAARITRTWGDAYGYMMVATGRADVMLDAVMNLWDVAALQPVIEEAGGKFANWQGVSTVHSCESVAATPALMPQVLDTLRGK